MCPRRCRDIEPANSPVDNVGADATKIKAERVIGTLTLCNNTLMTLFSDLNLAGINVHASTISGIM